MGVKKHISETRLSKSNSVDLYRPPALRHNSSEETTAAAATNEEAPSATTTTSTSATSTLANIDAGKASSPPNSSAVAVAAAATRRERRPDRAVYVPRARRSQTTPPTTTATTAAAANLPTCNAQQLEAADATVADSNLYRADEGSSSNGNHQAKPKKTKSHRERRERGKKTSTSEKPATDATVVVIAPGETTATEINTNQATTTQIIGNCDTQLQINMSNANNATKCNNDGLCGKVSAPLRIEDVAAVSRAAPTADANKCDNDERELQRASKEINRSNRRIMKQTFVSDVLEIPEKQPTTEPQYAATADSNTEGEYDDEEEEDDNWENMFDESGDCLDPKILQELSDSVGKCKIELPKMDYSLYHIKQSLLNEEEFPHVLEVSNFPVEFKTPDLLMLFSQYKGSGFDIKWVDDTHALAVFSSSRIAAEVLTMGHPFVKLKPLAEATLESRLKAKKCAGSLQPYRQRPETCTALARRLVSGALGVKLPTAPQERENERRVLREAKERKLLAAKQRDEAWES